MLLLIQKKKQRCWQNNTPKQGKCTLHHKYAGWGALNALVLLSVDENHEFFSGYDQERTAYSLLTANSHTTGFFINLAARHPLETSNSRALERELGWNGLCIEGNSRYWDQLSTLRSCTTIGAVVADQFYSNITFADMNRGSGGIVVRSREESIAADPDGRLWERNEKSKKKSAVAKNEQFSTMQAVSFGTILDTLQVPSTIDYLSLDVEGAEDLVLSSSFPFDRYTFTLMTIEGPFGKDSTALLANRLRSKGYRWLCRNGGGQSGRVADSLWAHESFEEPNDFDPSHKCMKNCHSAIEAYKKYGFTLNGDPCAWYPADLVVYFLKYWGM